MNINLIDSLLDAYPTIDRDRHKIISDIPLSNILTTFIPPDENKSEWVIFHRQLDQMEYDQRLSEYSDGYYTPFRSDRFEQMWSKMKLPRLIISKRLLEFFTKECTSEIKKLFNLEINSNTEFNKYKEIFSYIIDKFDYLKEGESGYLIYGEKGNSQIRYGKFVKLILDMIYTYNFDPNQRNIEIEQSVDQYKSKFSVSQHKVSVLNGDDILLGYDTKYHHNHHGGMLSGSCMNDKFSYLKLYTKNKDKIFLFVITNGDDKIISRNLVWKIKKYNNFFFDRVYAIDNYIRNTASKVAELEGWIIWNEGGGIQKIKMIDRDGEVKDINGRHLKIKLSFRGVKKYPYLDTFRYQRWWTQTLTNKYFNRLYHCYELTHGNRETHYF